MQLHLKNNVDNEKDEIMVHVKAKGAKGDVKRGCATNFEPLEKRLTLRSDGFVDTLTDKDKRICLVNEDYCKSPFSTTIVEVKDTKNAILFDTLPWELEVQP